MDFKFKGRTWAGNIYHRFEAMCQEVDDFVTKDSVKYVENQVQTVGESMKKLYSNVVHDFLPPVVDNKPNEGQFVTEKQNDDVLGTYIRSMVSIKEKHGHANENKSFKEEGDASEMGHLGQHNLPPDLALHQQAETDFYSEGGSNICISKNAEVVEESPISRFSKFQDDKSSLNLREQHSLPERLYSPEDEKFSGSTEVSNTGDQRSIFLTDCSPENFVDDLEFRTSQNDKTVSNSDDISEEANTGLSLEQDGINAIYKEAKMAPEENATNKEHPVSEGANTLNERYSSELISFTKEQHQMADDSDFLQDENSFGLSLDNENFKSNIQGKLSPVMLGHDTVLRFVQMEQSMCDNADTSEEAGANLSSEQHDNVAKLGISLEENVAKDVPLVVECKSSSNDKSCLKLPLCSKEQHPLFEESSNLEDENFGESSLIPNYENPEVTSIHDQEIRDLQDAEGLCDIVDPSNKAEKDLSLKIDGDGICMCSDLAGKENLMLTKYAVEESISSLELKSSSDLSLCSRKLHLQAEELDSLEDDNFLKSSPPLSDKDHKIALLTNFKQAMTVHSAELTALQMDENVCSPNQSSELVSSNICVENKVAESEVTSLNSSASMEFLTMSDISYANYTQKDEKSCSSYTNSTFLSRAFSAISGGHGDDSAVDIADPDMETIDLSDKVNLDESCIIVDNGLHYAASSKPRKFRSYKKLIQDAFASRKRLIKEYEQLAIWYGDIETETCPRQKQSLLPPVTTSTTSSRTSQTSDMCEQEWELL